MDTGNDAGGYTRAPTDDQIEQHPLVYLRTNIDLRSVPSEVWGPLSDYRSTPLPTAFKDSLQAAISEAAGLSIPEGLVVVNYVDLPPRIDGLFPTLFVDLLPVIAYLRDHLADAAIGDVMTKALELTTRSVGTWLAGRGLPESAGVDVFSGESLALLCRAYAEKCLGLETGAKSSWSHWNRRWDSGYFFPIDSTKPIGFQVFVRSGETIVTFTVDPEAHVLTCLLEDEMGSRNLSGVSIRNPDCGNQIAGGGTNATD